MRVSFSLILLLMVTACSVPQQQTEYYYSTVPSPRAKYYYPKERKPVTKPQEAQSSPSHESQTPSHEWLIEEDRFITSHDIWSSVDALKMPKEKIEERLDTLDTKH